MKSKRIKKRFWAALLIVVLPIRLWSQGYTYVYAPPEALANEGNSSMAPFTTSTSARLQQVYSASLFSSVSQGGWITGLSFRADGSEFNILTQIGSIQVSFSTTTRAPDSLSPVFSENIGLDETTVFGPGSSMLYGGAGTGFSSFIPVNVPFHYNPAAGNLLMDFRIFTGSGSFPATLDASSASGDGMSSVFATGLGLPSVGSTSTLGLATRFTITPVPEPSSWAIILIGFACFVGVAGWRKQAKTKMEHN